MKASRNTVSERITDSVKNFAGEIESSRPIWGRGAIVSLIIRGPDYVTEKETFKLPGKWGQETARSYLRTMLVQAARRHDLNIRPWIPDPEEKRRENPKMRIQMPVNDSETVGATELEKGDTVYQHGSLFRVTGTKIFPADSSSSTGLPVMVAKTEYLGPAFDSGSESIPLHWRGDWVVQGNERHRVTRLKRRKRNPKARDPEHRKLLKRLDTHFARDEKMLKRNPVENRAIAFKAISTKYIGASNVKSSRVKAWEPDGKSVTLSYDHALNGYENQVAAAEALQKKLGWEGTLVGGATKDGYVFTFSERGPTRRVPNPTPRASAFSFGLFARKGRGPRMHFDGSKFTTNGAVHRFLSTDAAAKAGREMLAKYPVLKGYRVTVEPNATKAGTRGVAADLRRGLKAMGEYNAGK